MFQLNMDAPQCSGDQHLHWMVGGEPWNFESGNPAGYPVGIIGWSMPASFAEEAIYRARNRLFPIDRSQVTEITTYPLVDNIDPAAYSGTPAPSVDSNEEEAVYEGPPAPIEINSGDAEAVYQGPPAPIVKQEPDKDDPTSAANSGTPAAIFDYFTAPIWPGLVTPESIEALYNMAWTVGGEPWNIRTDDFPPGYPSGIPGYSMPADFDLISIKSSR